MGISIWKRNMRVYLEVICDNAHGKQQIRQTFADMPDHFLPDLPFAAGWGTTSKRGERWWICPECSGKKTRKLSKGKIR